MKGSYNYTDSQTRCRNAGMELFATTNPAERFGITTFTQSMFRLGSGVNIKLNALLDKTDNKFYAYNPDKTNITGTPWNKNAGNECWRVNGGGGGASIEDLTCSYNCESYCEFVGIY